MSGIPNAPPFPVPYSAHTDIQLRDLYARVQGIERTVTIIEGQPVEVDFGTVRLMAIRPPTVAAVNLPYNRGWWGERKDPVLLARLKAPAIVLDIIGSINEPLVPDGWPGSGASDKLGISVSGVRAGVDATTRLMSNFARRENAYQTQGSPFLGRHETGWPVEFGFDRREDLDSRFASGLPLAFRQVGRILRTDVDLWVGMHHSDAQGGVPDEFIWDPDQKGSIDVVVTYVDSTLDRKKTTIHPINELSQQVLLTLGPFWEVS